MGVDSEFVPSLLVGKAGFESLEEAEIVESIQASSVRVMSWYGNIVQHGGKNEIEK